MTLTRMAPRLLLDQTVKKGFNRPKNIFALTTVIYFGLSLARKSPSDLKQNYLVRQIMSNTTAEVFSCLLRSVLYSV